MQNYKICTGQLVWRDRVRGLAIDTEVMSSIPATGHIRCALVVYPLLLFSCTLLHRWRIAASKTLMTYTVTLSSCHLQ